MTCSGVYSYLFFILDASMSQNSLKKHWIPAQMRYRNDTALRSPPEDKQRFGILEIPLPPLQRGGRISNPYPHARNSV
jgi:hypothetical protein